MFAITSLPKCLYWCYEAGAVEKTTQILLVDQARRRQFSLKPMAENVSEAALVMIESVLALVVNCANIHNDVTGVYDSWVAGAF